MSFPFFLLGEESSFGMGEPREWGIARTMLKEIQMYYFLFLLNSSHCSWWCWIHVFIVAWNPLEVVEHRNRKRILFEFIYACGSLIYCLLGSFHPYYGGYCLNFSNLSQLVLMVDLISSLYPSLCTFLNLCKLHGACHACIRLGYDTLVTLLHRIFFRHKNFLKFYKFVQKIITSNRINI